MKSYAIFDEELNRASAIGYLFYYDKSESFIVELCDDLDEWDAPLLFQNLVKEKRYTVPRGISMMWVKERIIPSGRQNIGSILKTHGLKEYREISMLTLSKGKCSQDSCYIKEIKEKDIPEDIKQRQMKNISECFPAEEGQIVCLFKDDIVKKVDLSKLVKQTPDVSYVLKNKDLLESVKVGPGGYSITFNDFIEIQSSDLRNADISLPITVQDFYKFVRRNIINTAKACDMLQCSRQNLSYLNKEGKLVPVIIGAKENLYLKGDIEHIEND